MSHFGWRESLFLCGIWRTNLPEILGVLCDFLEMIGISHTPQIFLNMQILPNFDPEFRVTTGKKRNHFCPNLGVPTAMGQTSFALPMGPFHPPYLGNKGCILFRQVGNPETLLDIGRRPG